MKFLLGHKIGMTRIFDELGVAHPVTVIQAGPCTVTAKKTVDKDGYQAIQIGFGQRKHMTKPLIGHLAASNVTSVESLRELRLTSQDAVSDLEVGSQVTVAAFAPGDKIAVAGLTKGHGFAGVVKRHGFAGGPASHGSDFHRAPGAIGGRWPQRVTKGKRMAGHMGANRVTIKGLQILSIDPEENLLVVRGAVPGPRRVLLEIRGEA